MPSQGGWREESVHFLTTTMGGSSVGQQEAPGGTATRIWSLIESIYNRAAWGHLRQPDSNNQPDKLSGATLLKRLDDSSLDQFQHTAHPKHTNGSSCGTTRPIEASGRLPPAHSPENLGTLDINSAAALSQAAGTCEFRALLRNTTHKYKAAFFHSEQALKTHSNECRDQIDQPAFQTLVSFLTSLEI